MLSALAGIQWELFVAEVDGKSSRLRQQPGLQTDGTV